MVLIADVIFTQGRVIKFRRNLFGTLSSDWAEELNIISKVSFTHQQDTIAWRWERSGSITDKSPYKVLNFRGITKNKPLMWWELPITPKVRIFIGWY